MQEVIDELEEIKKDIQTNLCFNIVCSECQFRYNKTWGRIGCDVEDFIDNHIEDYKKRTEGVKD